MSVLENMGVDYMIYMPYYDCNGKIVLTNGFIKKINKMTKQQIKTAKEFRADYVERAERYEEFKTV